METLKQIYTSVEAWGIHHYGWLFIAVVLIIPALVSGNMLVFYLGRLVRREMPATALIPALAGKLLTVIVCATIIAVALYLHF